MTDLKWKDRFLFYELLVFMSTFNNISIILRWRKYRKNPLPCRKITDKFYQIMLYRIGLTTGGSQPFNLGGERHPLIALLNVNTCITTMRSRPDGRPMQTLLSVTQSRIIATNTKALFFYYNLCISLKLGSLSCSFTSTLYIHIFF